jgi:DNA-binding transcriptional MerR regulator
MQIGAVAKETGVSIDTIRFYEKQGLLNAHQRSEGGFRLFRNADVERLKFVRKAQELGFSLAEIRELLALQGEEVTSCIHVQEVLERKLAVVQEKIEELTKVENVLKRSLRKCRRELKNGDGSHTASCPLLNELRHSDRRSVL